VLNEILVGIDAVWVKSPHVHPDRSCAKIAGGLELAAVLERREVNVAWTRLMERMRRVRPIELTTRTDAILEDAR
jgi:hypothetical protein